jgi:hypothetical protein
MELGHEQHNPPPRSSGAKGSGECIAKNEQATGVKQAEDTANEQLSVAEADEGKQRLGDAGEQDGTDKGTGHGAGEGRVIVGAGDAIRRVGQGRAVDEDVVGSLQVERLLDLGVGGEKEVKQGDEDKEGAGEDIF